MIAKTGVIRCGIHWPVSVHQVQTVDTRQRCGALNSAKCYLTSAESDSAVQVLGPSIFRILESLNFHELTTSNLHRSRTAVVDLNTYCQLLPRRLPIAAMMTNLRSNRNKAHLGLGALLIALCFISWLVLLGGIAAVQKLGE